MPHPNRLPFEGVLTIVDSPSDKAPSGARGHCVVLRKSAAESALETLIGMGVDYRPGWGGHDARRKIGVITSATIDGNLLRVAGHLYARDFADTIPAIQAAEMGMSYELADARVEDIRQEVWMLTRVTFTGAAILLRDKAAYKKSHFALLEAAHVNA